MAFLTISRMMSDNSIMIRQRLLTGLYSTAMALFITQGNALAETTEDAAALWSALAEGGKVILIRHAQSEEATPEVALNLDQDGDCSREQNLSAQAEALGKRLRQQDVEVETVLTSELCRARQTAELAFGAAEPWTGTESSARAARGRGDLAD
jgi:hypothetical protein